MRRARISEIREEKPFRGSRESKVGHKNLERSGRGRSAIKACPNASVSPRPRFSGAEPRGSSWLAAMGKLPVTTCKPAKDMLGGEASVVKMAYVVATVAVTSTHTCAPFRKTHG